jgi:hypothetical protein
MLEQRPYATTAATNFSNYNSAHMLQRLRYATTTAAVATHCGTASAAAAETVRENNS